MDEYESLNHSQWECLYHVVFIPKCRRRTLMLGCGNIWAKCFGDWPSKGKVESRKGI